MNLTIRTKYFRVPAEDRTYIFAASRFDKIREAEIQDRARPEEALDLFEHSENLLFLNYHRVKIF